MSDSKFKIGDRVAIKPSNPYDAAKNYYERVGTVVGMTTKSTKSFGVVFGSSSDTDANDILYTIEWGPNDWYGPSNGDELMDANECEELRKSLTDEFDKVSAQITEKMKDAAKLIDEAQELGRSVGVRGLDSLYHEVQPLMSSMEGLGWNTSSLNC